MKESDDIITPAQFIEYMRMSLKLPKSDVRLPSRGLLVFGGDDFETIRKAVHGRRESWSRWQAVGRVGRRGVFVSRSGIGAPAAATVLEEMAVRGVRDCITFGACGSLRDDLSIGDLVVPTFAFADEGTSRHYGALRRPKPDPSLVATLRGACKRRSLPIREGGVWTTDTPYRESRSMARSLARDGVVAVEMEVAALYAVGRYRGVRVASLLVVSDELSGLKWKPGFRHAAFLRARRTALRVLVDAIGRTGR